jgi:hypothetical protein
MLSSSFYSTYWVDFTIELRSLDSPGFILGVKDFLKGNLNSGSYFGGASSINSGTFSSASKNSGAFSVDSGRSSIVGIF